MPFPVQVPQGNNDAVWGSAMPGAVGVRAHAGGRALEIKSGGAAR